MKASLLTLGGFLLVVISLGILGQCGSEPTFLESPRALTKAEGRLYVQERRYRTDIIYLESKGKESVSSSGSHWVRVSDSPEVWGDWLLTSPEEFAQADVGEWFVFGGE